MYMYIDGEKEKNERQREMGERDGSERERGMSEKGGGRERKRERGNIHTNDSSGNS